jgi:single-strand DNA-binding protein
MSWEVPMINEAYISLSGFVATQPFFRESRTGTPTLSMRVAWTPRRLDRVTGEWVDASTSFASVICFRKLAENAATCLRKGDPIVLRGRVSVRDYEDRNGLQRTGVDIDATFLGHDLSRGVATFQRLRPTTGTTALEHRATAEEGGELVAAPAGPGDAAADDAALARLMASVEAGSGGGGGSLPDRDQLDGSDVPDAPEPGDSDDDFDPDGSNQPGGDDDRVLADGAVGVSAPF